MNAREGERAPGAPSPRRGRRARPLTPEELAEQERRRAEYERIHGPLTETAPEAPTAASIPTEPAAPTLRRFGRRARVIEVDEAPTDEVPADPHGPSGSASAAPVGGGRPDEAAVAPATPVSGTERAGQPATAIAPRIVRDADGVELGEMAVGDAPDPRPAPRFEGRVLHRPERGGGSPVVWVVWALVALALIALIVLLATGIVGPGAAQALTAVQQVPAPAAASPLIPSTPEVVPA